MYLQNKKGQSPTKFKADLLQFYLLYERPLLDSSSLPRCTFGKPDILSSSKFPSIGSYGVFYESGTCVEMSYFPASRVSPFSSHAKSIVRTARYSLPTWNTLNFIPVSNSLSYPENQGTQTLVEFGDALIDMEIGNPLFVDNDICESDLFVELIGRSKIFKKLIKSTEVFQYYNDNDFPQSVIPSNAPLGCKSIILIDADTFSLD